MEIDINREEERRRGLAGATSSRRLGRAPWGGRSVFKIIGLK